MQIRRKYPRVGPKLDVTPMADMVFLLLIFFMLSSPVFMQPGIKIKLPKTVTAEPELGDKLILNISKEKKLILNGKEVELENLERELRLSLLNRADKVLIVRADKEVEHGLVVEALDKAKLAGAEKLAIATEIKKEEAPKPPKGKPRGERRSKKS
jgi:biopolymer transport protein ExbD